MVASQHEEVLWILDLVGQHEADRLNGLFPSVDVVAEKQVVRIARKPCVLKQLDEVGILSVYVPFVIMQVPQILIGASSSSSIGCSRKIYRDRIHKPLI